MSYAQRITLTITTDGSGDGSARTSAVTGFIQSINYIKADSGGYSDGVDVEVTTVHSNQTAWSEESVNATKTVCPRQPIHSTGGVALEYATDMPQVDKIFVAEEEIEIVIADGGSAKTGTFVIVLA